MKKDHKRPLALILGVGVAASALNYVPTAPMTDMGSSEPTAAKAAVQPPKNDMFMALTIRADGELIADGENAGKSIGGVSVNDAEQLTFTDGGITYDLASAQEKLGVEVGHNREGEMVILSPFSTAQLIVRADSGFDSCGAETVTEEFEGIYLLEYPTVAEAYSAFQELSQNDSVTYVEPDMYCKAADIDETPAETEFRITAADLGGWGADAIGSKEYCDVLRGEKDELPEIVVAVIDTGIRTTHHAFEGRIKEGGKSFIDGVDSVEDDHFHGSHCSGIICSSTPENVKILPIKTLDEFGGGTIMQIYSGMRYAIEQNVDVISMSLGGCGRSNLIDEAVDMAKKKDIPLCVASGNEFFTDNNDFATMLSSLEYCVTVASLNQNFEHSEFSNGGMIDFSAPGELILSAYNEGDDDVAWASGTSMATPFVAACFADMFTHDPDMTQAEAYELLKNNALDVGAPGFDDECGWGMVNLRNFRYDGVVIAPPKADKAPGTYEKAFGVYLSSDNEDCEIYYTLDGSVPTEDNGKKYYGTPITIAETCELRAVCVVDGKLSRYEVFKYFIDDGDGSHEGITVNEATHTLAIYNGTDKRLDLDALMRKNKIPYFDNIRWSMFSDNMTLEELILPPEVKTIPAYAFANCRNLKKVTMAAEVIENRAFADCINLEELNDSCIKEIGNETFTNCNKLKKADFTGITTIPPAAFSQCYNLDVESFDMPKIESIEFEAFADSGLSGRVELTGVKEIPISAFTNTNISELILSPEVTTIAYHAFSGCSNLSYISAPGLKTIEAYGLALGKNGYSPDNVVKADIDFSKIEEADEYAFSGFVFDGDVSFDSARNYFILSAFMGAYGGKISIPQVTSTQMLYAYNDDRVDFFADVFELPNLRTFGSGRAFEKVGALIVGDRDGAYLRLNENGEPMYDYEFSLPICNDGANIYSYVPIKMLEDDAKLTESYTYGVLPALFCPEEHMTIKDDERVFVRAYALGDNVSGKWFVKTANGVRELDTPGDKPVIHDPNTDGSCTYVYRMYDENGTQLDEKEIFVESCDIPVREIELNGFDVFDEEAAFTAMDGTKVIRGSFTPEESGRYNFYRNRVTVTCYDGDSEIFNMGGICPGVYDIDLEAGKTYIFEMTLPVRTDLLGVYKVGTAYYAIHDASEKRECLSAYFEHYSINWSGFIEGVDFWPDMRVLINTHGDIIYLEEGVDYVLNVEEPLHYGWNKYSLEGIGNYFGILECGEVFLDVDIRTDEWFDVDPRETKRFAVTENTLYKFMVKPAKERIDKLVETNGVFKTDTYRENIAIIEWTDGYVSKLFTLKFNDEYVLDEGAYSMKDIPAVAVEVCAGSKYEILSDDYDSLVYITDKETLYDCTVDYKRNYEFNGEPVIPEITITTPDGTVLVEGEDYNVITWNNDTPGIMQSYIETTGDYPGWMCLTMVIEGGGLVIDEDDSVWLIPNEDVMIHSLVNYRLEVEEDSALTAFVDAKNTLISLNIFNDDRSYDVSITKNGQKEAIPAGTYTVRLGGKIEAYDTYRLELSSFTIKNIADAEAHIVQRYGDNGAELKLLYDGEELPRVNFMVQYEADENVPYIEIYNVTARYPYQGTKTVKFLTYPEEHEEFPEISDGINEITAGAGVADGTFTWTPQQSHYSFVADSYDRFAVSVAKQDGIIVHTGFLDSWSKYECDVTAGETYYVTITSQNKTPLTVNISGDIKQLSACDVSYVREMNINDIKDPEVTFTDGDYTLVEGVDYRAMEGSGIPGIGPREYVYEGMGDYYGKAIIVVDIYSDTVPELPELDTHKLIEGLLLRIIPENEEYMGTAVPGKKTRMNFTSEYDEETEFRLICTTMDGEPLYASSIFVYDGDGNYVGGKDAANSVKLNKGESCSFILVTPYVWDEDDRWYEQFLEVTIERVTGETVEPEPPVTTEPVPVTTEPVPDETTATTTEAAPVTTSSTTAAPVTTELPVTTEPDTTTSAPATTEGDVTTTAAPESSAPAATTAVPPEEGELPETGYPGVYKVILEAAFMLSVLGGAVYCRSRKEKTEK